MLLQPYLKANLWQNFGGLDTVTFASTDVIGTQRRASAFEIGGGMVARLSDALGIFVSAGYTTNLDDHRQQIVQGNLGLRVQW
jgi:outer membrane autotransporter protein